MSRFRSSFDLKKAIAVAETLSGTDHTHQTRTAPFSGVPLVSFESLDHHSSPTTNRIPAPSPTAMAIARRATPAAMMPAIGHVPPAVEEELPAVEEETPAAPNAAPKAIEPASEGVRPSQADPPHLPDLSGVTSLEERCEKIIAWITSATGATDVFIADETGLLLAGTAGDVEARLAGSGSVASAIGGLAETIARGGSPIFEMHLGEGPFFQLVGFSAGAGLHVVGFSRASPLTPRQAHAVRLACRHALGEIVRRTVAPPPRVPTVPLTDTDKTRRLLEILDARAPDPHIARLRVALRAGVALDGVMAPDQLGGDARVLVETAALEILGLDRAELRSLA